MNDNLNFQEIYLLLILLLNISCSTKEGSTTSTIPSSAEKIKEKSISKEMEKLDFTSAIRCTFQDSKGNYWIGTHREGVCRFDGKSYTYFTVKEGLKNNQIRTIQEGGNGNIWFGTSDGVSGFNGKEIINPILKNSSTDPVQSKADHWKLLDEDLWFNAGNHSGVYRFDGYALNYLAFPMKRERNDFSSYASTGFSKSKDGDIWIATYAAAINYDGQSFTIIDDESLGFSMQRGVLHIRSILEDSKGRLWIGNNGIGVLLKEGEKIINFSDEQNLIHPNSARSGDPSPEGTLEHVFAIAEDRHGNIWFGDRDTGAWKYDGKKMTNYTIDEEIKNPHIWQIYEERKGALLFAMEAGRVYEFNGETFDRKF